jgi:predicted esterase
MGLESPELHTFTGRLDCHYLLSTPEKPALLFAALHGFGQTPETMLQLTRNLLGPHAIASVQAPNQFYLNQKNGDVGYCWATHKHSESSVRLHHEMLLYVLDEAGRETGVPPERRLLIGFSQPVGMNYRFSATYPDAIRGVIGICGGVPKNWEEGPYRKVTASLLHLARREDEYYPPEVTEKYRDRLRIRADDVEFHLLEGAHRFPSKASPIVAQWLRRLFL